MKDSIKVIGGGIAGCEAAWQAAQRGARVKLYEMKPHKMQPAHTSPYFSELVCSNSLRGASLETAPGLLKEELRRAGSLFIASADLHQVPAGGALAVDREKMAQEITQKIKNHPLIEVIEEEAEEIDKNQITIIATGPLTEGKILEEIKKITGDDSFYFYDAAAPIVSSESIDYSKVFWASRYDKGTPDYLNCPMTKEEYEQFYQELVEAEAIPLSQIDKQVFFEGCMPLEVLAKRGPKTLLFGCLKPVGLKHPDSGQEYYAVVQLRKENQEASMFNLVGFQTNLKWGEQKRIFSMIPGLENADFLRYGVMHRNSFINSPTLLNPCNNLKENPKIFFAGQITGVEGYIESAASGYVAGVNASRMLKNLPLVKLPIDTAIGSLHEYIVTASPKNFQPMNINFGLLPGLEERIRNKKERYAILAQKALKSLEEFLREDENAGESGQIS